MAKVITARGIGGPDYIFIPRNRIHTIRSDKDVHFTGSLAKNASESENITGLQCDKIVITSVAIKSKQSLRYRLHFFSRDGFTNSDLDSDAFLGSVDLDLPTYGLT